MFVFKCVDLILKAFLDLSPFQEVSVVKSLNIMDSNKNCLLFQTIINLKLKIGRKMLICQKHVIFSWGELLNPFSGCTYVFFIQIFGLKSVSKMFT